MKRCRQLVAIAIGLFVLAAHSAEFKRSDISSQSKWIVHMDFDRIRDSNIGKYLLSLPMEEKVARQLNSLKVLFGIDLLVDVKSLTAYGSTADRDTGDGVVLVRAKFDKAKILAVIQLGEEYKEETYGACKLIRLGKRPGAPRAAAGDKPETSWGCFYAEDTIVFARDKAALKKALDTLDGKLDSLAQKNPFANLTKLERNAMFMATANLGQIIGIDPKAKMLQQAKSLALCIREETVEQAVTFNLQAVVSGKTLEGSQRIRRSLDGLIAMLQLGMEDDAQLKGALSVLDRIRVTQDGSDVSISFQCPVKGLIDFVGMLKKLESRKQQQVQPN